MLPAITVVVSDFGEREPSWDRLRSCLRAVAAQETAYPFEVVLCEMLSLFGQVPHDIRELLLGMRVLECEVSDPNGRKTFGVQNAGAPIVALLDADCLPQPGWLKSLGNVFRFYPEVAAVRGRMVGESAPWWRQWIHPSDAECGGPVRGTAGNNVAFRREAYLEYPLPEGTGDRAVKLQSAAMLRARYVLWEEPRMQVLRDSQGLFDVPGPAGRAAAASG